MLLKRSVNVTLDPALVRDHPSGTLMTYPPAAGVKAT
jgi:hypothetical protein